jgi:hypothetical protein
LDQYGINPQRKVPSMRPVAVALIQAPGAQRCRRMTLVNAC